MLHIWALHVPGNNNPTGIDVKSERDTVPFHPYYTIKDGFALVLFALFFAAFVFDAPNLLGHPDNYVPANPLQTPQHIVPEWYFLPFYAILRAIPSKLFGVAGLPAPRRAVLRSVARYLARALDELPADLQMVLLDLRGHLPYARLSRLAAAGRHLSRARAHFHCLLFRVLSRGDAGGGMDRKTESAAWQHHRIRARARGGAPGHAATAPRRRTPEPVL